MKMKNRIRSNQAGYNLIEILIAMSLLGVVMLSVMSLFFLSRKNVYSGKQLTQGVAMGTHVLEDLSLLTVDDVYLAFTITSTSVLGNYTIEGVTYNDVVIRSTDPNIVASPPAGIGLEQDPPGAALGFLSTWRNEITNNNKFRDGSVTLLIAPKSPATLMDATITTAPSRGVKQIRAIVRWQESGRWRTAIFDTTKVKR